MKPWPKELLTIEGREQQVRAPLIISASRATDIPALYPNWLVKQFRQGYTRWINPFNGQENPISLKNCRLIIFWTKNPAPLIPYLDFFDSLGIDYYFLYTLNDYQKEHFEKNIPDLRTRLESFKQLSKKIGSDRIIWRFDPILVSATLNASEVAKRIGTLYCELAPYTKRLIFSFISIDRYKSVKKNIAFSNTNIRELTSYEKNKVLHLIKDNDYAKGNQKLQIQSCGTAEDLSVFNINHGCCVDYQLITKLFSGNGQLMDFLEFAPLLFNETQVIPRKFKASGQQPYCNCIQSVDIGFYNSCIHGCVYCYANHSHRAAVKNHAQRSK